MLKRNLANIITVIRIMGTAALLFIPVLSVPWLAVYALCGISDVADGTVARKLKITSRLGSKLDTVADFFFYTVMLVQLLPRLVELLPGWIWYFTTFVLLVRACYYGHSFIRYHSLASTHAILNKMTSFMIFLIPYAMNLPSGFKGYCFILMGVSLSAAIQDWMQFMPEKWRGRKLEDKHHA